MSKPVKQDLYVVNAKDTHGVIRRGVLAMPKQTAEAMCETLRRENPELVYWAAAVVAKVEMTVSELLEREG